MKKAIYIALLAFAMLLLGACMSWFESPEHTLVIKSQPSGADAYIDKFLEGDTPVRIPGLAPGTYLIEIRKIGYLRSSFEFTIDPDDGEEVVIDHQLEKDPNYIEE